MRVEINFAGDSHDAVISSEEVTRAVRKLFVQAEETAQAVQEIKISSAQAAESSLAARRMAQSIEQIGQEARKSRREIEQLKLAGQTGRSGVGVGVFGSGFGRLGLLGSAIGLGVATSGPLAGGAGALGLAGLGLSGGALGAVGVLVASFQGLGKAVEGDRQAFEKLSPSTQRFVQDVRSLIPWLHQLQDTARGGLLPGLDEGLHSALNPQTAAAVQTAVRGISTELGNLARQAGQGLGGQQFHTFLTDIGTHGVAQLDELGHAAGHLADALLVLDHAGQPLADWMAKTVDDGARFVDQWTRASAASGTLAGGLGSARHELELVGRLVGVLADAAIHLSQDLTPLGNQIIVDLTKALEHLDGWLQSNHDLLVEITTGALAAFESEVRIVAPLVENLATSLNDVAQALGGWKPAFEGLFALGLANKLGKIAGKFTEIGAAAGEEGAAGGVGLLLKRMLALKSIGPAIIGILAAALTNSKAFSSGGDGKTFIPYGKNGLPIGAASTSSVGAVAALTSGQGIQLMTSQRSTHQTEGLAGFPAVDIMAKPGTPILAPEDGMITRISGHEPTEAPPLGQGGPWGLSIYYVGSKTGNTYYMTHLMKVGKPGSYRKGAVIGIIGDYPGSSSDHVHFAIHQGASPESGYNSTLINPSDFLGGPVGGPGASSSGADPFGTPPPFTGGTKGDLLPARLRLAMAKAGTTPGVGDDRTAINAAIRWLNANLSGFDTEDQINAYLELASLLGQLKTLAPKVKKAALASPASRISAHTEAAGLLASLHGDPFTAATAQPQSLSDAESHLAAVRKTLTPEINAINKDLRDKTLTAATLAVLRAQMGQYKKTITSALTDVQSAIERQKSGFQTAWQNIAQAALDAFDKETAAYKSPSRLLLDKLTSDHDQQQLQDALTAANADLAKAMVGQLEDPQGVVQRAREYVGKTMLANAVDAAQSAILGGASEAVSGTKILSDLQQLLVQNTVADPDAVAAAQKEVEDAKYNITVDGLSKQADAEETAYADQRAALRTYLENIGGDWETYFQTLKGNIAAIPGWWTSMLNQLGLPGVATSVAGDPAVGGSASTQLQSLHQQALAGQIDAAQYQYLISGHKLEIPGLATGGIVRARPGGTIVRVGEGGQDEFVGPMSKLGGQPITVVIQTKDEALADFIDVRVEGATAQINRSLGQNANRRQRAGRY